MTLEQIIWDAVPELIATLVGVTIGGTLAFTTERLRRRRAANQRARTVLHSIVHELELNHEVMTIARPDFKSTEYGKSFFIQTVAWETALASEQLPNIIGFRLADVISSQYGLLLKLRHYGDLMVKVWLTTPGIEGYREIQAGFRTIIAETMDQAMENHPDVMKQIRDHQQALRSRKL